MAIQVIDRPDSISWDQIHELLNTAHSRNLSDGIVMRTALISGDELAERVGKDGYCFVALEDGRLVGTISLKFLQRDHWYHKGTIAYSMMLGILPEASGKGIYSMLKARLNEVSREHGVNVVEIDTNERNRKIMEISERHGYHKVRIKASHKVRHYSVVMVKWLDGCPFSERYCRFRYTLQSCWFRMLYKRGHILRLFFWKK